MLALCTVITDTRYNMANQATNTYTKEFGPELAGELVGWVGTTESDQSLVHLSIAIGVVSTEGAGYTLDTSSDSSNALDTYGFEHVAGVSVTGERKTDAEPAKPFGIIFRNEETDFSGPNTYHRGTITLVDRPTGFRPDQPIVEQGSWHIGNREIVDGIKQSLTDNYAMWLYPQAYYLLAYASNNMYLLSDREMHSRTKSERTVIQQNHYDLVDAIVLDTDMQRNLTVFHDHNVTADNVTDIFTDSRHRMMELERQIAARSIDSIMEGVIPQIGRGKNGQTWPFRNASANSDEESFGLELVDLQNHSIERAHSELGREMKELVAKKAMTDELLVKLAILSRKEKAV